tara:strand:+ start:510 stop:1391 length:882 start_codon:yes stop_codon:yes gene_type:complete
MAIYKTLEQEPSITSYVNSTPVSIDSSSVQRFQFLSGSTDLTASKYYDSLRINYYASGSGLSVSESKFNRKHIVYNYTHPTYNQQVNKFHKTGSIVSIPSVIYGEGIERGSFILTDTSTDQTIVIQDDTYGNLFASGAFSSASNSHPSSSDNYIGNIWYEHGVFVITDTGSFSASVASNYTNVTSGNYDIRFNSVQHITTTTWRLNVKPNEYNQTNNPTIREKISGSFGHPGENNIDQSPRAKGFTTGSTFTTFATEVGLYNDNYELMAVAKISQPVKIRKDIDYFFNVKLDS